MSIVTLPSHSKCLAKRTSSSVARKTDKEWSLFPASHQKLWLVTKSLSLDHNFTLLNARVPAPAANTSGTDHGGTGVEENFPILYCAADLSHMRTLEILRISIHADIIWTWWWTCLPMSKGYNHSSLLQSLQFQLFTLTFLYQLFPSWTEQVLQPVYQSLAFRAHHTFQVVKDRQLVLHSAGDMGHMLETKHSIHADSKHVVGCYNSTFLKVMSGLSNLWNPEKISPTEPWFLTWQAFLTQIKRYHLTTCQNSYQ